MKKAGPLGLISHRRKQIVADAFGMEVVLPAEPDSAALGAALQVGS